MITFLATLPHVAYATDQFVVRHYQSTDGLPVSSVAGAQEGSDGFLWLATYGGPVRFDGREFKVYNTSNSPAIRNNRIVDIYRGAAGRSYALTFDGDLLRLGTDGVRRITFGPGATDSRVRAVHEKPFCVTAARGLFCEKESGGFGQRLQFEPGLEVAAAFPVAGDSAWLLVPGKGILLQTGDRRRQLFDNADLYRVPGLPPKAIVDRDGGLAVALEKGVVHIARDGHWRWLVENPDKFLHIVQVRQDGDGTFWVGTDNGLFSAGRHGPEPGRVVGAVRDGNPSRSWRAPDGALWRSLGHRLFREDFPVLDAAGVILAVDFDTAGTAWVSTRRDGLYALSRPRVDMLGLADGLLADNLYTVARDEKGTMWLGSLGGPVQAIAIDGSIRHFGLESGLPGMNPRGVVAAPDGAVYVGTFSPGLFRKDAGSDRFEKVSLPSPLAQARVWSLSFDRQGRFWLGTTKGVWRREGGDWHRLWPEDRDIAVHAVLFGADDCIWYGTEQGLWRQRDGIVEAVAADIIGEVTVRGLLQDSGDAIWASTEGYGLVRIDESAPAGIRAVRLGRAEGLPSDSPHAALEDDSGNIWVNSNQGIFRIAPNDLQAWLSGSVPKLTPLSLGLADGVTELEGNGGLQPAAAFDLQGRMWFPSQRGIIRIDPRRFSAPGKAPLPVIDGLEAGGAMLVTDKDSLPTGVRSVNIHYGAPDLHSGNAVRFRYRLFPRDERWIGAGNQRTVSFASLLPGDYRFEVIAAGSDGVWSPVPATLAFSVPARWYETAYFKWSLWLCLAGLLFLVAQLRVHASRKRAEELGRQVEARTRDLHFEKRQVEVALTQLSESHHIIETKNLHLADQASRLERINEFRTHLFADISHELRTPLMLASMPLKEVKERSLNLPETDQQRLALSISQMDRLTLLVEQLLSLAQAEAGQLKLSITAFDLCQLVEEVLRGFRVLHEKSDIHYEIRSDTKVLPIFADRAHLTTVLDNLLDNAGKYAPRGSSVEVQLSVDTPTELVRIAISDSGPGFSPSLASDLFRRFFRGESTPRAGRGGLGIGLATARELVELHGGDIGAISKPGEGACFWIRLPLGSAHVSLDELDSKPARAAVSLPTASARSAGARKVLIVEDHPELASYLGHRLGEYCPVQLVADAEQALAWLEREAFGMVITDVVLPGRSGIDLCRDIKSDRCFAQLPVLLISARAESARREEALAAGADDYLIKPFGFEALLAAVSRAWPNASLYFESGHRIISEGEEPVLLAPALKALADPDFNVGKWAQDAYLSERQLRRKVTELTGQSPVAWLREQRLLRVRKLISEGRCRTLAEAGNRVGLDNPTYLYRIYRARFGVMED
ncbi:ATP-binding protein [Microbulbifer taiwanensis]|uniref:ATP-binding protein n=1 Tax=Microbulbifer taiwanensis TaxID=986746 RepID=UPI001868416D|nr:ATP-binding protein [Microbulbifer taiwanensis]